MPRGYRVGDAGELVPVPEQQTALERMRPVSGPRAADTCRARRIPLPSRPWTVHLGVAGDGALLHVEAFAFVGLGDGADPGVAECAAGQGRMAR